MFNFDNQVAVVTGGTRGIGRGITEAFLNAGARVIATYSSNDDKANAFKNELGALGENLTLKKFDVSDAVGVDNFWSEIQGQFEKIDILIITWV